MKQQYSEEKINFEEYTCQENYKKTAELHQAKKNKGFVGFIKSVLGKKPKKSLLPSDADVRVKSPPPQTVIRTPRLRLHLIKPICE